MLNEITKRGKRKEENFSSHLTLLQSKFDVELKEHYSYIGGESVLWSTSDS